MVCPTLWVSTVVSVAYESSPEIAAERRYPRARYAVPGHTWHSLSDALRSSQSVPAPPLSP